MTWLAPLTSRKSVAVRPNTRLGAVLALVDRRESVTAKEVGMALGISTGQASGLLGDLKSKGLLTRTLEGGLGGGTYRRAG